MNKTPQNLEPGSRVMSEHRIPFVDLTAQYRSIEPEIMAAFRSVIDSRAFIQGPHVAEFEQAFCAAQGVPHAIGCSNGTSAIEIALKSLDIGPGDEVITVAHTFFATAEAILNVGATPVFADIDPKGYGMRLDNVSVTSRTRALMPVHLYGAPCAMDAIMDFAKRHKLVVIEDAAQAHLASYRGRKAGAFGEAATFSFYPGKNLGAYGDAGLIAMRDAAADDRARRLIDHGRLTKYEHGMVGTNCRMDGMQAAFLSVKLRHLEQWTAARRKLAALYDSCFKAAGFKVLEPPQGAIAVYHLYVLEVSNREAVVTHLASHGVQTGIHYPVPLHRQPALADMPYAKVDLPVTERVASRILSLPMYAELTETQVTEVCDLFLQVARP